MHMTNSHDMSIFIVWEGVFRDSELVFLIWTLDPAVRRTSIAALKIHPKGELPPRTGCLQVHCPAEGQAVDY